MIKNLLYFYYFVKIIIQKLYLLYNINFYFIIITFFFVHSSCRIYNTSISNKTLIYSYYGIKVKFVKEKA